MRLAPRQLRRTGMTGDVPYYGGRLTPAQAYAASHPGQPLPAGLRPGGQVHAESVKALQHLLEAGVISAAEHHSLRARVPV